jgi:hypothetical protein
MLNAIRKYVTPVLVTGAILGAAASVTACSLNTTTTIDSKYACTKVVNGHKEKAWCVNDSNSNTYYVPYYLYLRIITGQNEDRYLPKAYTSRSNVSVPHDDIPAEHVPVHVDPVEVHPVVVDR